MRGSLARVGGDKSTTHSVKCCWKAQHGGPEREGSIATKTSASDTQGWHETCCQIE